MRKPAQLCLSMLQTVAVAVKAPSAIGGGKTEMVSGFNLLPVLYRVNCQLVGRTISLVPPCFSSPNKQPPVIAVGGMFDNHTEGPAFDSRVL